MPAQTDGTSSDVDKSIAAIKREKSWTDSNGRYKESLLAYLDCIIAQCDQFDYGHCPMGQIAERRRLRRQLAERIAKEGILGIICANLLKMVRTFDEHDKVKMGLVYLCFLCLQNFTDDSDVVVRTVAIFPGLLEYLHDLLQTSYKQFIDNTLETNRHKCVRHSLYIVHNCGQHESSLCRLRSLGFVDVLEPYLRVDTVVFQLVVLGALACIIDEDQSQIIADNEGPVRKLASVLREAMADGTRRSEGYTPKECAFIVRQLARNDANKKLLVDAKILEPLSALMKTGTDDEQLEAVRALRVLAFNHHNQDIMIKGDGIDIVDPLISLMKTPQKSLPQAERDLQSRIKEEATRALWNMRLKLLNHDKYKTIGQELEGRETGSGSSRTVEATPGHVMLSYQWGSQAEVLKIHRRLVDTGLRVWIDVEFMEGSTLQAMAEAVEKAEVVLICMTHKYKDSPNCRAEAEYAFEKRKKIIPCQFEAGYRADGWLGIIVGTKLRYDFSGRYPFEAKLGGLLREIWNHFEKKGGIQRPVSPPSVQAQETPNPPDVVDSHLASDAPKERRVRDLEGALAEIRQWKQDDVQDWIKKEKLSKEQFATSLSGEDIAMLALMLVQAPDSFYSLLQGMLQVKEVSVVSRLTWALRGLAR